jgi:hypothetical protein
MGNEAINMIPGQARSNNPDKIIIFPVKKYVYYFTKKYNYSNEVGGRIVEWKYACRFKIDPGSLYNKQYKRMKLLLDGRHRIIENENRLSEERQNEKMNQLQQRLHDVDDARIEYQRERSRLRSSQ